MTHAPAQVNNNLNALKVKRAKLWYGSLKVHKICVAPLARPPKADFGVGVASHAELHRSWARYALGRAVGMGIADAWAVPRVITQA